MANLDYLCAKYGQELSEIKDENILQKALGVLREDGIYAMFLWLENKNKNARHKILSLLNDKDIKSYLLQDSSNFPEEFDKFCKKLVSVLEDVDRLFLLKKILERTLTYALYHVKAGGENVEKA